MQRDMVGYLSRVGKPKLLVDIPTTRQQVQVPSWCWSRLASFWSRIFFGKKTSEFGADPGLFCNFLFLQTMDT